MGLETIEDRMAKSTSNSKSSSADGMQEPGRRDFIVVATYAMGAVGAALLRGR